MDHRTSAPSAIAYAVGHPVFARHHSGLRPPPSGEALPRRRGAGSSSRTWNMPATLSTLDRTHHDATNALASVVSAKSIEIGRSARRGKASSADRRSPCRRGGSDSWGTMPLALCYSEGRSREHVREGPRDHRRSVIFAVGWPWTADDRTLNRPPALNQAIRSVCCDATESGHSVCTAPNTTP